MRKLGDRDERVVAITAAMTDGTGLKRFHNMFPERFFDVGIAEQHAVTFAAGLAAGGLKPIFAVYSSFYSAPTTRSSTTSVFRTCRWYLRSTVQDLWAATGRPTREFLTSPISQRYRI